MKPVRGYYCLIQYCPDPGRAEAVNVGVLLSCQDRGFVQAAMRRGNDRIAKVFGRDSFSNDQLNAAKKSIQSFVEEHGDQLATVGDLQDYVSTRANEIILSDPRPVRVESPMETLHELFESFVGGKRRSTRRRQDLLRRTFRKLQQSHDSVRINETIELPDVACRIHADYLYENGCLNLVKPQDFSTGRWSDKALKVGAEGLMLQKHFGRPAKMIVVSQAAGGEQVPTHEVQAGRVLEDFAVRLVRSEEIEEFVQEVEDDLTSHRD